MATTTLLFKTDKQLKEQARAVVRSMGIPLSAYLNAQLRQLVNSGRIVFDAPEIPNAPTARQLKKTLADARIAKNMSGPYNAGRELDDHLMSLS